MENTRQYMRAHADLPVIATDKAGFFVCGQVIDITIRGCGLRLTTPPLWNVILLRYSGSPRNGRVSLSCACRLTTSVACTNSGTISWHPRSGTRCSGTSPDVSVEHIEARIPLVLLVRSM